MTQKSVSRSSLEKSNLFKNSNNVEHNYKRLQAKSGEDPSAENGGYTEEMNDLNQDQNMSNADYDTDR
jgi:hypothetical protein